MQALRSSGQNSPLYRWLKRRHDGIFAAMSQEIGRPDWKVLAAIFSELGMPVTPERARKTWWKVRRDVARERQSKSGQPAVTTIAQAQPPPPEPSPPDKKDVPAALARVWAEMNARSGKG